MKIKGLSDHSKEEIAALMRRIPFFKQLHETDTEQLHLLLQHSSIVELDPSETIMRRGDKGSWLYFLIKGRLSVYLDSQAEAPLNHITPGELFGDLALLCDYERKATVAADTRVNTTVLFATDFKIFGDLLNFNVVTLRTKLIFYRTMVHSIRWRLEVNRMQAPDHSLIRQLQQVPIFQGKKGTREELVSLHEQAQFLATLLDCWNSGNGTAIDDLIVAGPENKA